MVDALGRVDALMDLTSELQTAIEDLKDRRCHKRPFYRKGSRREPPGRSSAPPECFWYRFPTDFAWKFYENQGATDGTGYLDKLIDNAQQEADKYQASGSGSAQ